MNIKPIHHDAASPGRVAAERPGTDAARKNTVYWSLVAALWTVCVSGSLAWNLSESSKHDRGLALQTARALYEKDVIYREWSAGHGGVYVPVSASTQPNPFLKAAERDITTPSGRQLTLMNPAYMTRQIFELQNKKLRVRGHITSLNPIRPQNAPDAWEEQALAAFEQGVQEVSVIEESQGVLTSA
jgi:hypothetical protein